MKKILFLDIDNTLYSGKSGIVPASALRAIEKARKNGSIVFLCTGRSKAEASRYLDYGRIYLQQRHTDYHQRSGDL